MAHKWIFHDPSVGFPQKHLASSEEPLAQGAQILRLVVGWYLRGSPMAKNMLKQEEFFQAELTSDMVLQVCLLICEKY